MSRVVNLTLSESAVREHCRERDVGVSSIEVIPGGGVRLVCMSSRGAETVRRSLSKKLIDGNVVRMKIRTARGWR